MLDPERVSEIIGKPVVDVDGEEIGVVADAFLNSSDDRPAWVAVDADGKRVLAPLDGARYEEDQVVVAHPAELVLEAPGHTDEEGVLSPHEEDGLYDHYDMHDSALRSDTGHPANLDGPGAPTPQRTGSSRNVGGDGGADDAQQGHP